MDIAVPSVTGGRISATRLAALLRGSTYATLLIEHGSTVVPLRDLAETMLGTSGERAHTMANKGQLDLPVFRAGGRRSPWLVHLYDLAQHIDAQRTLAGSANVHVEAEAVTEAEAAA
jgi:hypothetical protein